FMFADLRVPVERTHVEVLTADGNRHALVVFHAPGIGLDQFVESPEPFFPARDGDAFRMFSRANMVTLSVPMPPDVADSDEALPTTHLRVRVHLIGNAIMTGEVRFVPWEG